VGLEVCTSATLSRNHQRRLFGACRFASARLRNRRAAAREGARSAPLFNPSRCSSEETRSQPLAHRAPLLKTRTRRRRQLSAIKASTLRTAPSLGPFHIRAHSSFSRRPRCKRSAAAPPDIQPRRRAGRQGPFRQRQPTRIVSIEVAAMATTKHVAVALFLLLSVGKHACRGLPRAATAPLRSAWPPSQQFRARRSVATTPCPLPPIANPSPRAPLPSLHCSRRPDPGQAQGPAPRARAQAPDQPRHAGIRRGRLR
jgi:hypothetical protein